MAEQPAVEGVIWKLEDLYNGPGDPALEADRNWCREEADRFAADYRGRVGALSSRELLDAITRMEVLQEKARRGAAFAFLNFSTQTQDPAASSLMQSYQEFYSALHRDTLFFGLEWTQLDDERARRYLEDPVLSRYRHHLELLRRYKPHMLTEAEERLLAEKEPAAGSAWSTLFDKVTSHLRFGDRKRTQSEVLSDLYRPDRDVRKEAARELTEGLDGVLHVLTHTFNTILLDKAISDRIRKYPHWLSARNLDNEADDGMVEALAGAVSSRYDMVHRYYGLKAKLLGHDTLYDYDRYAPIPGLPDQVFSWDEARETVLTAYGSFSPEMADIARRFFEERWIHAPVLPGKRAGAFSHSTVPSAHPYVLLNYTGKHRDVTTLAHELGHGVHQYLAREQGLFNGDTPLTTAETASVFGEMLVFRHLLGKIRSPRERLALLCGKLEDAFATIFRQVSMNRFEDAVHKERREKGELSAERIADLWMQTQQPMFGDSVTLLEHYRTWWSYIPHFVHTPGYVYAYAFGELLVFALYRQYQERGESFVPMYFELLRSGGKAAPNELLRPFGIDLGDPDFWLTGLRVLEGLLEEAEKEAG